VARVSHSYQALPFYEPNSFVWSTDKLFLFSNYTFNFNIIIRFYKMSSSSKKTPSSPLKRVVSSSAPTPQIKYTKSGLPTPNNSKSPESSTQTSPKTSPEGAKTNYDDWARRSNETTIQMMDRLMELSSKQTTEEKHRHLQSMGVDSKF
jgi:hypothetical protein